MSLENLKSVFKEDLNNSIESFSSNVITDVNGTNFFNTPPQPTIHIATNPTDFSTANGNNNLPFTPLSQLGQSALDGMSWESLYNPNHTFKDNAGHKGLVPINYPNSSRDNLNIRGNGTKPSIFNLSRTELLGLGAGEPYIINNIATSGDTLQGGRLQNQGPLLGVPINRMLADSIRIGKYLTSPDGIAFTLKQNFLGENTKNIYMSKNGELQSARQRFKKAYNPLSTLLQTVGRAGFGPIGNVDKTEPGLSSLFGSDEYGTIIGDGPVQLSTTVPYNVNSTFTDGTAGNENDLGFGKQLLNTLKGQNGVPVTIKEKSSGGDKYTLAKIVKGTELLSAGVATLVVDDNFSVVETLPNIDSAEDGMPFYFKDLRDNSYIFFRAFIEGLTENISPSYAPHNYVGRSEPVWTYERAEREITMTLKLVAQTQDELTKIYEKMDRLTSLCYPEYIGDDYGNRMKPPLTKFRYGEYFGKSNKELMGYIKTLSYSIDQSSTYETDPAVGRVPRHVTATIGYQVIHAKVPSINTKFYGINQ